MEKAIRNEVFYNRNRLNITNYNNLLRGVANIPGYTNLINKFNSLKKENVRIAYCSECGTLFTYIVSIQNHGERRFCCNSCQARFNRREERENRINEIKDKINKNSIIKDRFEKFKEQYIKSTYYWASCQRNAKYEDKAINSCLDRLYYAFETFINKGWEITEKKIHRFCRMNVRFAFKMCYHEDKERYIKDCNYKLQHRVYGSVEKVV